MYYRLYRVSDGGGDEGSMSLLMAIAEDGKSVRHEHHGRPCVNAVIRVGKPTRAYLFGSGLVADLPHRSDRER
jgi:hypothetical protein